MKPIKIVMLPIDKIHPHPKNAKKHPDSQVKSLAEEIKRRGWDVPIVVDKDGVIIKGHGRRLAAMMLGMKQAPCIVRDDLTPEQADAARIADNYVVSVEYDQNVLREAMQNIVDELRGIMPDKELEFVTADLGIQNTDVFVPDLTKAVEESERKAQDAADAAGAKRVPLTKAFGFKDIAGSAEILVTRWMAKIEAETGLTGDAALVAHLQKAP